MLLPSAQMGGIVHVRLDPGGGNNAPKMRHKGLPYHGHAQSLAAALSAQPTPGQEGACDDPCRGDMGSSGPANTDVLGELKMRAGASGLVIQVIGSADRLRSFVTTGGGSNAKIVVFNPPVRLVSGRM